jgi:L-ascorbate metabolism protein UlaG (beta-lactamase superfamily)
VSRISGLVALAAMLGCTALPVPRHAPYHGSDADLSVTRIGHGSVVVELHGTRLLVDPWFYSGFFSQQREPLGLTPDALPPAAAVLLTHSHGDRFDRDALAELATRIPLALGPPDLHERLVELGFGTVVDLSWWDTSEVDGAIVTAVPARHAVPENGYVVEKDGVRVYLAGDTRWFPELADVATRFPRVDAALLPVGGERLLGFPREMSPADAARAAALLDPHVIIPYGYGKRGGFPLRWYSRHPTDSFIAACKQRGIDPHRIVTLDPGESWHYYK